MAQQAVQEYAGRGGMLEEVNMSILQAAFISIGDIKKMTTTPLGQNHPEAPLFRVDTLIQAVQKSAILAEEGLHRK
ncbi:hypothetical protein ACFX15_039835 [Malus domestica]